MATPLNVIDKPVISGAKIEVLDFLRGIASLGVCVGHMVFIASLKYADTIFKYGSLGVPVFFVISGFIIPYSLYANNYRLGNYFTFILKRIVRLDPPYFVTIGLIIAMQYAAHVIPRQGAPFNFNLTQVLLHLGYLNAFVGYQWLNAVFWTLAVEFQFYLLIGLVYPLLFSRDFRIRIAVIVTFIVLSQLMPHLWYVFGHLCQFLMGIVACQYRIGLIGKKQCILLVLLAAVFTSLASGLGVAWTIAGVLSVVFILNFQLKSKVALFFGNISYSLYLLHAPVGYLAHGVFARLIGIEQSAFRGPVAFIVPLLASILAAYLLYRFVELPARKWSKKIRYSGPQSRPLLAGVEERIA